ncbi:unnamed protein product [Albugo candida]|uniref:Uncharacterized protein n=1 Tax=Albugo candida TaxID=65357 RepID=A0A024GI35_9STRA|nr:unnamed protein product [Albugo candida]|eukprot:CCI46400.1 unnamed protein product [Albugo candida]
MTTPNLSFLTSGSSRRCNERISQGGISHFLDMPSHSSNVCRLVTLLQQVVLQILRQLQNVQQFASQIPIYSEHLPNFFICFFRDHFGDRSHSACIRTRKLHFVSANRSSFTVCVKLLSGFYDAKCI